MTRFIEHCARLAHRCCLFRIDAIVCSFRVQTESCTRLRERSFCLLHAETIVSRVDDGDDLSFRDDATEIYGDRADPTRNFDANCCLIESGEGAVGGYSLAERCFGPARKVKTTTVAETPFGETETANGTLAA